MAQAQTPRPGTPQSYTPYATPYAGAAQWYCSNAIGSDGSCSMSGVTTSLLGGSLPGSFTSLSALTLGVGATGMVGDGATDNTAAFNANLSASGGYMQLPCGTFKITGSVAVTLNANAHITITGGGHDCTTLLVSATSGPVFNYNSSSGSSVTINEISVVTDQAGGFTGITLADASYSSGFGSCGYAPHSNINGVVFRGNDGYGVTDYWQTALSLSNVCNVNVSASAFYGASTPNGVGIGIIGKTTATVNYAVAINVQYSFFNLLNKGIVYNSYVQGLQADTDNFTGDNYGIYVPASITGTPDQISVVNSQFNCLVGGIYLLSNVNSLTVQGGLNIINANDIGIYFSSQGYSISGVVFAGASSTNNDGVFLWNGAGGGNGVVSGNTFWNMNTGIALASGTTVTVTGNALFGNTTNISNNTTSAYIFGNIGEIPPYNIGTLPPCGANTEGLGLYIYATNANAAPTYHGAVASGGATTVHSPVYCNGTSWLYD